MATTAANRWLGQYGRTLEGDNRAILGRAMQLRDDQKKQQIAAGANPVHLNDVWGEFSDFHKVRQIEEGLKGNKYGVNAKSISGGGDLNQRPLTGGGATTQVNAMQQPRRTAANYLSDDYTPSYLRQARWDTEMAELQDRRNSARGNQGTRALQAQLDAQRVQRAPGSQLARDMQFGDAAADRQIASDDSWQQAADESGQFWRYQLPVDEMTHGRNVELARERAMPARIAADSRQAVQQLINEGRLSQEELRVLSNLISATQRGEGAAYGYDNERAANLGQRFDDLSGVALGATGRAAGPGPAVGGAPEPPPQPPSRVGQRLTNRRTGVTFVSPDGVSWQLQQ